MYDKIDKDDVTSRGRGTVIKLMERCGKLILETS